MPKKKPITADRPLREAEIAAYDAYREWPILLVLRKKELEALRMQSEPSKPADEKAVQP